MQLLDLLKLYSSKDYDKYRFWKIIDTSDEWITKRTGIKERRIAEENEASSDLGAKQQN